MTYAKFKRLFDFIFAFILLSVSSPFFVLIPVLIKMEDSKGSVIFKQQRIGENEHLFTLYKFRSMRTELYKEERRLTDTERMLRIGRFIRKTSLDELPQLVNILKGEMSFIGPRPLLKEYLPYYTESEKFRHDIKPGISGWAQINGRNNVTWEEKFSLDIYYVKNISLTLDAKIFFVTIKKVLLGSDIVDDVGLENTQTLVDYRLKQNNLSHNESTRK
ncbi:hypothetical protein AX762_12025 [Alkalibacterium sp. 20]|nr:hypothetical protein AX762_12025 [Alkalibacterium sp. 20]